MPGVPILSLAEGLLVRLMEGLVGLVQPVGDSVVVTAVVEEAHKPLEQAVQAVLVDFLAEAAGVVVLEQVSAVLQELEAVAKSEFIHGRELIWDNMRW